VLKAQFRRACIAWTIVMNIGCGSEVRIEQRPAPSPTPTCDPAPPPAVTIVSVETVTSGVFIDDTLHIAARINGVDSYVVLGLANDYAWIADQPTELLGPANLVPVSPGVHARFIADGVSISVDIINTSAPAKPILKQTLSYMAEVQPTWQSVFSIVDDHLLFCGALSPNPPPELHSLALDGSTPPLLVTNGGFSPCSGLSHDAGVALGKTWTTWGTLSDLFIYEVSPTSFQKIADYQYNPDGIHAYGPVLSAATDGERMVFDPGNENEFFLYSVGSNAPIITHTVFGLPGPKRLLGVVDHIVYVVNASGIRAYDASVIGPPTDVDSLPLLDYNAEIPFGPELGRLIAANDKYLAVVDASNTLYLAHRDKSGPVKPLEVHREAPAAPTCTDGK
jgi:hypothetical protein